MGVGFFFRTARDLASTSSCSNLGEAHAIGIVLFELALTLI